MKPTSRRSCRRAGRRGGYRLLALVLATAASAHPSCPVQGQENPSESERLTLKASLDVPSRYLFRGYELDERGAVFQPGVSVHTRFHASSRGFVRGLSAEAFAWSSIHAGSRAFPGNLGVFEVDLGASIEASFSGNRSASLVFTSYFAPGGAFEAIHELGLAMALGVIGEENRLALLPSVFLAKEFYDGGGPEDTYLEVGANLSLPATGVVRWTLPLTVGMSVDGFYRNVSGGNEWFGFVGTGLLASAALDDLGLHGTPISLVSGVDVTVANRDAGLTHQPSNDVLWTARIGLSVTR